MELTHSKKPYFLRAIYQWIADGNATPYIKINLNHPGVRVPDFLRRDRQGKPAPFVVLNIAMRAAPNLSMENGEITFSARFSGASHDIVVPCDAVMAIYAQESGDGMAFPETMAEALPTMSRPQAISAATPSADEAATNTSDDTPPKTTPPVRGHLKVVK